MLIIHSTSSRIVFPIYFKSIITSFFKTEIYCLDLNMVFMDIIFCILYVYIIYVKDEFRLDFGQLTRNFRIRSDCKDLHLSVAK